MRGIKLSEGTKIEFRYTPRTSNKALLYRCTVVSSDVESFLGTDPRYYDGKNWTKPDAVDKSFKFDRVEEGSLINDEP